MVQLKRHSVPLLYIKIDSVPALFFKREGKVAFAWGYSVSDIPGIPSEDCRRWERGVIWCDDLESALSAWRQFRMLREEAVRAASGGAAQ